MTRTKELVQAITKGIQEKKGQGIAIADMNGIDGAICNYFIICQGNSPMYGLPWTIQMSWFISSFLICESIIIWKTSGKMLPWSAFPI